jgi:hypothetical protein
MDFEMGATLKPGLVGSDDPVFFILSRFIAPGEYTPVYKSEVKVQDSSNHSIKWNRSKILTATLCKEEGNRDIRVDIYKS